MKIPKELNRITPLSKRMAFVIMFVVPLITFIVGFFYGIDIGNTAEYPTINKDILKNKRLVPTDEWQQVATKSANLLTYTKM